MKIDSTGTGTYEHYLDTHIRRLMGIPEITTKMTVKREDITYEWASVLLGLSVENKKEIKARHKKLRSYMHSQDISLLNSSDSDHCKDFHKLLLAIKIIVININLHYSSISEVTENTRIAIEIIIDNIYPLFGNQRKLFSNNEKQESLHSSNYHLAIVLINIKELMVADDIAKNDVSKKILIECETILMGLISTISSLCEEKVA